MYIYTATFMEINIFRTLQRPAAATKISRNPYRKLQICAKILEKGDVLLAEEHVFRKAAASACKIVKKKK